MKLPPEITWEDWEGGSGCLLEFEHATVQGCTFTDWSIAAKIKVKEIGKRDSEVLIEKRSFRTKAEAQSWVESEILHLLEIVAWKPKGGGK